MKQPLYLLLLFTFLIGCNSAGDKEVREGKGGIHLGGVFRVNEVMDIRSLYPLEITELTGFHLANQVYESMVKFDQKTLEPIPALAERWESNEDATVWTFRLREGVYFHDDPCFPDGEGRELTAEDVAYTFKKLCSPGSHNQMFWLVRDRLKGARSFYEAQLEGEEPEVLPFVEVLDRYTLKVHLEFPFASFLRLMGHAAFFVYPQEAIEHYGDDLANHAVGTGPFTLKVFSRDETAVLERNPNYWAVDERGNSLPYLDGVQFTFVKDKKSELLMFKNGELDMIFTLPLEMYDDVMGDLQDADDRKLVFKPQVKPSLSVHYYSFLHSDSVFSDVRVRKAFNMAVDREALVRYTLQGEGTPGVYGIIPPVFENFPHDRIRGIGFDPEQARELLAQAGYPNGEGFPTITLHTTSGGQNYELVAQVLQQMLSEALNIKLEMKVITMAEQGLMEERGESTFWRSAWLADYPDPENFLCLFLSEDTEEHSASYLNTAGYESSLYDSLYNKGIQELNEEKRYEIFSEMDQILIDQAVIMPLYYEEFTRLLPKYVHGFPQNAMEYRDFSTVWIEQTADAEAL